MLWSWGVDPVQCFPKALATREYCFLLKDLFLLACLFHCMERELCVFTWLSKWFIVGAVWISNECLKQPYFTQEESCVRELSGLSKFWDGHQSTYDWNSTLLKPQWLSIQPVCSSLGSIPLEGDWERPGGYNVSITWVITWDYYCLRFLSQGPPFFSWQQNPLFSCVALLPVIRICPVHSSRGASKLSLSLGRCCHD